MAGFPLDSPPVYETAQRRLVCSLLDEALALLAGQTPVSPPPSPPLPPRVRRPHGRLLRWDAAQIVAALHAFQVRTGHPPGARAWKSAQEHALPGRSTVLVVFGSLPAAYAAAGLHMPWSFRRR